MKQNHTTTHTHTTNAISPRHTNTPREQSHSPASLLSQSQKQRQHLVQAGFNARDIECITQAMCFLSDVLPSHQDAPQRFEQENSTAKENSPDQAHPSHQIEQEKGSPSPPQTHHHLSQHHDNRVTMHSLATSNARKQLGIWACQFFPEPLTQLIMRHPDGQVSLRKVHDAMAEPALNMLQEGNAIQSIDEVYQMMNNPRYWQGDLSLQRKVQEVFERIYQ